MRDWKVPWDLRVIQDVMAQRSVGNNLMFMIILLALTTVIHTDVDSDNIRTKTSNEDILF